jgi:Na+/proline symporter
MLRVLPAVLLALFVVWLDGRAVLAGGVAGTALGTWLLVTVHCKTTSYSVSLFGHHESISIGILAVLVTLAVALAVSGAVRVAAVLGRKPAAAPAPAVEAPVP